MQYKRHLRSKIDGYQSKNADVTLSQIAGKLEIEPSYLSRFLGDPNTHFSDDLLYRLSRSIEMSEDEFDHLLLYREYDRATHADRKRHLEYKLRTRCLAKSQNEIQKIQSQLQTLVELAQKIKETN